MIVGSAVRTASDGPHSGPYVEDVPSLISSRLGSRRSRRFSESVPKALFRDLSPWTLVSKPISVLLPGQPAEHQLNHADLDLRFAGISQMLIVLAVNSA